MNKRTDKYDGSPENCVRLIKEIVAGIKGKCGDFIIIAKLNAHNTLSTDDDYKLLDFYCNALSDTGVSLFEISGRDFDKQPKEASLYYLDAGKYLKEKSPNLAHSIVGSIYCVEGIEKALETTDYVSMSRALLTQPELITLIV